MMQPGDQWEWPEEYLLPDYDGGSIGNVPATVAALLGVPFDGLPPLRSQLWQPMAHGVKRVVLLIIDAWGWNLLEKERSSWESVLEKTAVFSQLTSVFPSTTVAALSTLWTGAAPAQHGLVGLRLFMPDYAVMTQFIHFTPTFRKYPDALIEAGLDPEQFLRVPGFAEQLAAAGINTHAFKGKEIIDSALSMMHGRGVSGNHGAASAADMFVQMRQLLETKAGESLYACAYWPTVDTLSHTYTWQGESVAAELRALLHQFDHEFLEALSPEAKEGTAVFILADHGQAITPARQRIYLEDHPTLQKMLFMRPAGEPRTIYFYARHGCQQAIIDYVNNNLSEAMVAISVPDALAAGLLGPNPPVFQIADRLGDVIVTMRQGYVLLTEKERAKADRMQGRHGGLTKAEMQVPWLGFRLDG